MFFDICTITSSTDYDSSSSGSKDKPLIITPPEDVQVVIDKMAAYVARNGDEFAEIVRAKNDPRFTFLDPENIYHAYYKRLMQQKRGGENGKGDTSKRPAGKCCGIDSPPARWSDDLLKVGGMAQDLNVATVRGHKEF